MSIREAVDVSIHLIQKKQMSSREAVDVSIHLA